MLNHCAKPHSGEGMRAVHVCSAATFAGRALSCTGNLAPKCNVCLPAQRASQIGHVWADPVQEGVRACREGTKALGVIEMVQGGCGVASGT